MTKGRINLEAMRVAIFLIILGVLSISCSNDEEAVALMDEITSATVAFAFNGPELDNFFADPTEASVSGYFYFEDTLADDVIFGLDIEWLEGMNNPVNFEGADWMALAGFNRKGILWFPIGSPENRNGVPTDTDLWEIRDIGTELSPNTWYRLTIRADFRLREFHTVQLTGGGIDFEIDISGFPLEYPNYIPFDEPSLTFYTFAIRSREFSPDNSGETRVYFDDIEGRISTANGEVLIFENGFEGQNTIGQIPVSLPVSPMAEVEEDFWYFENEDAKIRLTSRFKRSGEQAMECDASLSQR